MEGRVAAGVVVMGVAAAAPPAWAAWSWDTVENASGADDPSGMLLPIGLFLGAWVVALVILAASPRPRPAGTVAGALVATLMVVMLVRIGQSLGVGGWVPVVVLGSPFVVAAFGLGVGSGFLADRIRQPRIPLA